VHPADLLDAVEKAGEATWFYVRGLWRAIREKDLLLLASGLAFNGVLTMIPLLLLAASALGMFLHSSDLSLERITTILDTLFPPQPFATSIKNSILTIVRDIVDHRTSIGAVGALILVWTGMALFDSLRSVLHAVYGIRRTRGLLQGLLHEVGFVFLVFLLFLATSFSLWILSVMTGLARNVPALAMLDYEWVHATVPTTIVTLLTAVMFYVVYRFIPDRRPPRAAGVISTLTTTVLWVVSGRLFALYLEGFSAIGKVYGPYAFILVFLIWIYYSSIIFVLGGMVGQVYWERRLLRESGTLERWV
jgi:membrane protein